jgi:hypothetical protein
MYRTLACFVLILLASLIITACNATAQETPQAVAVTVKSSPLPTQTSTPLPPPSATPPPTVTTQPASPTPAPETPTAELAQPYPFTTPLPPPIPTELDGIYTKAVEFIGTPTPCRRCAPYRAEGGTWTLDLKEGIFRVSHDNTPFRGLASFTVSGNQLFLFNDPNCHLEVGIYTWTLDGRSLVLEEVDDPCAFGLRAKNLAGGSWLSQMDEEGRQIDQCQPPSLEAAISGHWPAPPGC